MVDRTAIITITFIEPTIVTLIVGHSNGGKCFNVVIVIIAMVVEVVAVHGDGGHGGASE